MISTEKPGTPEELVHYGVKGMKWGVRKQRDGGEARQRSPEEQAARRARAKKIAIGAGILVAVAGAGYVAYKLNQSGNLPISSAKKTSAVETQMKKVFDPPTSIIHSARGKTKGYQFFQRGGLTDPEGYMIDRRITSLGNGEMKKLDDGSIYARLTDPLKRVDEARRPIGHDIVIPKAMASGIETMSDVESKIWPLIKDAYDET